MKKFVFAAVILIVLSSCGAFKNHGNSLRLVRVGEKEEILVERKKEQPALQNGSKTVNEEMITGSNEVTAEASAELAIIQFTKNQAPIEKASIDLEKIEPEEEEPTEAEMIRQAYRAEKDAKRSMVLLILSTAFYVLAPLLVAATILMGIGIFYYVRASRARYITPFGEKRQRTAMVFLILSIVGLLIWTGLIALLIIFW